MKTKIRLSQLLVIGCFFGFFLFCLVWGIAQPDRPSSAAENRSLAQRPAMRRVVTDFGGFAKDFESYAADQFPDREQLIGVYTALELAQGKKFARKAYCLQGGWLLTKPTPTKPADLSALPVYLNDRANITMGAIRSQCKAMHRRGRCGMVIIDYLQLLDTTSRNTNSTREREIAAASRSAKLLAKELDVPVILLSQLSRKVEERADKTPLLSDLRESGAIEQDADMVLFLDRPAMYGAQTIDTNRYGLISSDGVGIMHVTKNREGATGRIYFRHNKSLTRITDYDSPATDAIGEAGPF